MAPPQLGDQLNALESKDQLAFMDPVSGQPIAVSSARGRQMMVEADKDFLGEYSTVNTEIMDVLAEYTGNPYADKMADALMGNIVKQGNVATTGQTDPASAQQAMEDRQMWESQQEIRQQAVEEGAFKVETREAGLDVSTRDAERLVETDPAFADLLGEKIIGKMQQGKPLTRQEKLETANAVRTHRTLQEKAIAQRARSKDFFISPTNVTNPENWEADMMVNDGAFQYYHVAEMASLQNAAKGDLMAMEPEDMESILRQFGAGDLEIQKAQEGLWADPVLSLALEAYANSTGAFQTANDRAWMRRMPELERQQPELGDEIDARFD